MEHGRAHDHFDRWAATYDRHWLQPLLFEPLQRTALELARAEVPSPRAVLDIGCGTGRLLRAAEARFPEARLVGVDAALEMGRNARAARPQASRIELGQAAAEALPFGDGQFDLVFSTLTFHHWSDQQQAAREVARVLSPGGRWLLADFVPSGLMKAFRGVFGWRQFPDRASLAEILAPTGLRVLRERPVRRLRGQVPVLAIGFAFRGNG